MTPPPTSSIPASRSTWGLYQKAFLEDLRARNLSPRTVETSRDAIRQLGQFLEREHLPADPQAVRPEQIRAFITDLLARHSASTANNRYRALNAFFNWLVEQEYLAASPMAKLKPPRVEEKVVPVIPPSDMDRLFKHLSGKDFESRRDRAIFSVLVDTGMRLSECAEIRFAADDAVNDVDTEYGQIRVFGKGGRERIVSLGRKARGDLNHYLLARARHPHAGEPYLWLGRRGRMTNNGIYQMARKRGAEAGISNLNPHRFRHTFAHEWLAHDGNEGDLMRLTGWHSRTMLQRYGASAGSRRALDAHKRNSPRDRVG